MIIALICMIPVSIIATGFLVLKSVQLGLKWNMQTQQNKEPELNPVKPFIDAVQNKQADKANQYTSEVLKEWLNGA